MKQEDKELLLKDLCARLPYGVKCNIGEKNPYTLSSVSNDYDGILIRFKEQKNGFNMEVYLSEVKPYLFHLSSMTEEQTKEVHSLIYQGVSESVDETKEWLKTRKENELRPITLTYLLNFKLVIDWLNENHFDYRGLIKKGLAIDATGLNIY